MSRSEETVFAEALEKHDTKERVAYLDEACAGDARLRAAVSAIKKTLPSPERVESTPNGDRDPSEIVQPLSRLKELLEADDGEAAEFIAEAESRFSAILSQAEIENLTRMVGDFDYAGALRAVSGIADRLCVKLD